MAVKERWSPMGGSAGKCVTIPCTTVEKLQVNSFGMLLATVCAGDIDGKKLPPVDGASLFAGMSNYYSAEDDSTSSGTGNSTRNISIQQYVAKTFDTEEQSTEFLKKVYNHLGVHATEFEGCDWNSKREDQAIFLADVDQDSDEYSTPPSPVLQEDGILLCRSADA